VRGVSAEFIETNDVVLQVRILIDIYFFLLLPESNQIVVIEATKKFRIYVAGLRAKLDDILVGAYGQLVPDNSGLVPSTNHAGERTRPRRWCRT